MTFLARALEHDPLDGALPAGPGIAPGKRTLTSAIVRPPIATREPSPAPAVGGPAADAKEPFWFADGASHAAPRKPAGTIVDDDAAAGPGQMTKTVFLAALRAAVEQTATRVLGPTWSLTECEDIPRFFARQAAMPAAAIEALVRRYAQVHARDPGAYLTAVCARLPAALDRWVHSHDLTWEPDASGLPRALGGDGPPVDGASPAIDPRTWGAGAPLDDGTRARMEGGFQTSFGDVRVHQGGPLADLARARGADAAAAGRHVGFTPGAFEPGTPEGDGLIAHELAHVVQQRGAAAHAQVIPIPQGDDALEDDADRAASAAVARLHGGRGGERGGGALAGRAAISFGNKPRPREQRGPELLGIEIEVGLPGYITAGTPIFDPQPFRDRQDPPRLQEKWTIPVTVKAARCIVHEITDPTQNPDGAWVLVQVPCDVLETIAQKPEEAATKKLNPDHGVELAMNGKSPWQGMVRRGDATPTPLKVEYLDLGRAEYEPVEYEVCPYKPQLQDVSQRFFGTCYLESAFIAIIAGGNHKHVDMLAQCLHGETPDEISARFYHPLLKCWEVVRVVKSLPEGKVNFTAGLVAGKLTGGGTWSRLIEKAYASWPGRDHTEDGSNAKRMLGGCGYAHSYPGAEGGHSSTALLHLLGPDGNFESTHTAIPKHGPIGGTCVLPWDGALVCDISLGGGMQRLNIFDPGPDEHNPQLQRRCPSIVLDLGDAALWSMCITNCGQDKSFVKNDLAAKAMIGKARGTLPQKFLVEHLKASGMSEAGCSSILLYCREHSLVELEDEDTPADIQLYMLISDALSSGGCVALGTPAFSDAGDQDRTTVPNLPGNHAYGVVGVHLVEGKRFVSFRNPHETPLAMTTRRLGHDARDATTMPIAQVRRYCNSLYRYAPPSSHESKPSPKPGASGGAQHELPKSSMDESTIMQKAWDCIGRKDLPGFFAVLATPMPDALVEKLVSLQVAELTAVPDAQMAIAMCSNLAGHRLAVFLAHALAAATPTVEDFETVSMFFSNLGIQDEATLRLLAARGDQLR